MRRLTLPSPIRDARTLRTLALLDLESHPPAAADRSRHGRHRSDAWTRTGSTRCSRAPHPTPDQLSTLLARLSALMGAGPDRRAATVDSYRPGAFAMKPFEIHHPQKTFSRPARSACGSSEGEWASKARKGGVPLVSALRRCRHPVPARVIVENGHPVRVTTNRREFAGGRVTTCAGPWRTSGAWWVFKKTSAWAGGRCDALSWIRARVTGRARQAWGWGRCDACRIRASATARARRRGGGAAATSVLDTRAGNGPSTSGVGGGPLRRSVLDTREGNGPSASGVGVGPLRRSVRIRGRATARGVRRGGGAPRWDETSGMSCSATAPCTEFSRIV